MRLVQAALFCTLASEAGRLSVCSVGLLTCFNCGISQWAGDTDSVRSPGHESTTGWGLEDGASLRQQTAQSSDQLFNRFSIWWRKLTYKNDRFILTHLKPVILNGLFSKENNMQRLLLTWCWQLALFERFSIYQRLFSTSIQSSSSCKTRLHSTFTRILLHLLQVTSTTSFSDIHFSHM